MRVGFRDFAKPACYASINIKNAEKYIGVKILTTSRAGIDYVFQCLKNCGLRSMIQGSVLSSLIAESRRCLNVSVIVV